MTTEANGPAPTQGRRVYDNRDGYSFGSMEPGDYGIGPDGDWWLVAPNGARGKLDLSMHTVAESPDGAITVGPSLVFMSPEGLFDPDHCNKCRERARSFALIDFHEGWHGWLDAGIWTEAGVR